MQAAMKQERKLVLVQMYHSMIECLKYDWLLALGHKRLCHKRATVGTFTLNLLYKATPITASSLSWAFIVLHAWLAFHRPLCNAYFKVAHFLTKIGYHEAFAYLIQSKKRPESAKTYRYFS